jgi:hypothetical protein
MYINYGTHYTPDFLALLGARFRGGIINIWPVKPFETVPVIQGYTYQIELS